MPTRYPVGPNTPDSHQAAPSWAALIVRFARLRTYDHSLVSSDANGRRLDVSHEKAALDPVRERPPLLLTSSLLSASVTETKASHVTTANLRLAPTAHFDRLVCAGDWVFLWCWDNLEDAQRVLRNVRAIVQARPDTLTGELTVNGFRDGLRFVGRCNAPKEDEQVEPNSGIIRSFYDLTAVAFGELDSKIYYGPAYKASNERVSGGQLFQLNNLAGAQIDQVIGSAGLLTTREHFLLWSKVFLGAGPGAASKGFDPVAAAAVSPEFARSAELELVQSPNTALLVPWTAARLLGVQPRDVPGRAPTYVDVLNTFCGVQAPRGALVGDPDELLMVPVSFREPSGVFVPQYQAFDGGSIWELLSRYSNQPVNEMFTSLRLDSHLRVRPALVLRQTPFTSKANAPVFEEKGLPAVPFAELPRWVLHPVLVQGKRTGASDSLRVNYVSIQASDIVGNTNGLLSLFNHTVAPPMADFADIMRMGLRPYIRQVNSDLTGAIENRPGASALAGNQRGRMWTAFMGDILLPGHLKHSGHIACYGIQAPVAVGDNIEYRDIVFHIESRTDVCGIDENGRKSWRTTFQVSNGISTVTDYSSDDVMPHEAAAPLHARAIDSDDRGELFEGEIDFSEEDRVLRDQTASSEADERRQVELVQFRNAGGFAQGVGVSGQRPGFNE